MYDVIIIGAGVSGSAAARELSRYRLSVCVLEREEDVCSGTSKANSGVVHAGYDALPGTLKAKLNILGNEMMDQLCSDLDIPFRRIGSLVVCAEGEDPEMLHTLLRRGMENSVPGLRLITDRKELEEMEPNIGDAVTAALYAPTAGIICPFTLNLAMAENAAENGVEFRFSLPVEEIRREDDGYSVFCGKEVIRTRTVFNAAGVYGDVFHNQVSGKKVNITPRRGEYLLYDKKAGSAAGHVIFSLPGKKGKGILVAPTVHGNLLMGPTAEDVPEKEMTDTTAAALQRIRERGTVSVKNVSPKLVITSFAGLRAHEDGGDFIIREAEDAPGFVDCIGIESPGLTACPAIGVMAAEIICGILHPEKKDHFLEKRQGIRRIADLPAEERNRMIRENPAYGRIVCRCEEVSEGEILEALHGIIPAVSMDGIKRRVRAGMGRCQGGFCTPKVMDLLARECSIPLTEVKKSGSGSPLILSMGKRTAGTDAPHTAPETERGRDHEEKI